VKWFDLRDPATWEPLALQDAWTLTTLRQIQTALGYAAGEN
jgi:hypothetical protein